MIAMPKKGWHKRRRGGWQGGQRKRRRPGRGGVRLGAVLELQQRSDMGARAEGAGGLVDSAGMAMAMGQRRPLFSEHRFIDGDLAGGGGVQEEEERDQAPSSQGDGVRSSSSSSSSSTLGSASANSAGSSAAAPSDWAGGSHRVRSGSADSAGDIGASFGWGRGGRGSHDNLEQELALDEEEEEEDGGGFVYGHGDTAGLIGGWAAGSGGLHDEAHSVLARLKLRLLWEIEPTRSHFEAMQREHARRLPPTKVCLLMFVWVGYFAITVLLYSGKALDRCSASWFLVLFLSVPYVGAIALFYGKYLLHISRVKALASGGGSSHSSSVGAGPPSGHLRRGISAEVSSGGVGGSSAEVGRGSRRRYRRQQRHEHRSAEDDDSLLPGWLAEQADVPGDVHWTRRSVVWYPIISWTAGFVAAMMGVGGGMITNPVMLEMGIVPAVAAATSSFMMIFTASASSMQYIIIGRIDLLLGLLAFSVSFSGALLGQVVVSGYVKRHRRQSYLIFMLVLLTIVSGVCITTTQFFKGIDSADFHTDKLCGN